MKIEINKASYEDMSDVAEILKSSAHWYEKFVDEKDMDQHNVDEEWIDENYKKREFYVTKNKEGKSIGTISLQNFDDQTTYLGYVYLDVNYVGNGIGRKLISFAEELSSKRGQEEMILLAHPEAKWATKAYEKYGFEKVHDKKEDVISYKGNLLESYYEEGFHLYRFKL